MIWRSLRGLVLAALCVLISTRLSNLTCRCQSGLLTPRTVQAHCTFLDPPSLAHVAQRGTAVAHCPLSNAYFSAEPFRLREALRAGVKVGLGTDIAGGYAIDIMSSMRQAVAVSGMREGARLMRKAVETQPVKDDDDVLSIDWK